MVMGSKDTDLSGVVGSAPHHVAIVMDGNGRWAQQKGKPRLFGHHAGAKRVREIVETCPKLGVKYLTIFAFSTENWKRSQTEVTGLMTLFKRYIKKETRSLVKEGVRVRFIGCRERLNPKLRALMEDIELQTQENDYFHLTIAMNYGGRDDLARAIRRMTQDVVTGNLDSKDINEQLIGTYLDTQGLPDPDLVIRTSGEKRVSNFLLWQAAYAEYEFVDTLWPDFSSEILRDVVDRFRLRDRRFGKVVDAAE